MAATKAIWQKRYPAQPEQGLNTLESLKGFLGMVSRGCFHRKMSRPFTSDHQTHRVCTNCGARRRFDPHRWEMYGPYFIAAETPGDKERGQERHAVPDHRADVYQILRAA